MSKSNKMKVAPVPLEKLEKIGITRQDFDSMPKELKDPLLSGHITPLMRLRVPSKDNRIVEMPMKIQLAFDKSGELQLLTYQINKEVDNRMRLTEAELERTSKGEAVLKEVKVGNNRKQRYVQLDKETNSLMYRDVATVQLEKKLQDMEKVKDISLGLNQKEAALYGKPVELNVGDEKVTVGVDLREPQGFKLVRGDMEEWKRQQAIRYDDAHEGFMGYVQTDENRWEYQQVVKRLDEKNRLETKETLREKKTEKRKAGISV